jgi:hypothetical protein
MDGSTLNTLAYENMLLAFEERNHEPSKDMLAGLRGIMETNTKMLLGEADSMYYLSSLDPGVGKSTAIIKWIDAYLRCRATYGNHGIIICFDRLEEIKRFVDECNIPSNSFAVIVSNVDPRGRDLNMTGLGMERAGNAQVLFTTKQQIIIKCKGKGFLDTSTFFYMGEPRRVRIWDESMIVGKALVIDRFKLSGLAEDVSKTDLQVALKIEDIATELRSCKNGDVYLMPDLGLTLNDMMYSFTWSSKAREDAAETLGMFLGRAVTVRTDDRGHVAVDCGESVPADFTPCLVTDASGRVRETYNLQHEYRGDLIRLQPYASKEYNNLTISVWSKASGKAAYAKNGCKVYSKEIIEVINSRLDEEFLVVRHLEHQELEAEIIKQVTCPDRVKFIHWGIHTATNEYSNIPNVIITSPLTYRLAAYEALARASATLMTKDGCISDEQQKILRYGENAHHLLQAVCRGLVRKSKGAGCPQSRVWIITSPRTMIERKLRDIFPNCQVETWRTSPEALKGSQQRSFEYILNRVAQGTPSVTAVEVRKLLGMTQSNFKRDMINNDAFVDTLALHKIYIEQRGNRYYFNDNSMLDTILSDLVETVADKSNQNPNNYLF